MRGGGGAAGGGLRRRVGGGGGAARTPTRACCCSEEVIDYLIAKWDSLEPLVRTRLLLSPLLLKKRELADLQPALARLAEAGRADKCALGALAPVWEGLRLWFAHLFMRHTTGRDEWVRVTAKSVGSYEGWLHTNELAHESKLVAATMGDLGRLLAAADPVLFRPREVRGGQDDRQLFLGGRLDGAACATP